MEDGLLINLANNEPHLFQRPGLLAKGSWKKRHVEKRRQKAKESRVDTGNEAQGNPSQIKRDEAPAKAVVVDNDSKDAKVEVHGSTGSKKDSAVISSLYTYNPQAQQGLPPKKRKFEEEVTPSNAPGDRNTFSALGLSEGLCTNLEKLAIVHPTGIQKEVIPLMLSGGNDDIYMQAQTGSGKTLAYLLPVLQHLLQVKITRESGCYAILLAPTRELCRQIHSVLQSFLPHYMVVCMLSGGERKKSEKARLRRGCNIVVATPGRLADHLENTSACDIRQVRWMILDEGDRLMDLGFQETIQKILSAVNLRSNYREWDTPSLPLRRVTVLCSATLREDVEQLRDQSLPKAHFIRGEETVEQMAPTQLQQECIVCPAKLRLVTLVACLQKSFAARQRKVIVFLSCADSVNFTFSVLTRQKSDRTIAPAKEWPSSESDPKSTMNVHRLHGSLAQIDRVKIVQSFIEGDISLLLCTDVAARGLDLPGVDKVVEFDPPFSLDDHLHRVGRTARAGKSGASTIFLLPGLEENYVTRLSTVHTELVHADLVETLKGSFGKRHEEASTEWELQVERWILAQEGCVELARRAFQSHIRAYATHLSAEKGIFNLHDLHLGHLAKSFGLRESPTGMTMVKSRASTRQARMDDVHTNDAKRMKQKMHEHMNAASEFNIG